MCILRGVKNGIVEMDSIASPYELFSPDCINSQLKQLVLLSENYKKIRYEEEIIIELSEDNTKVIKDYVEICKEVEKYLMNPKSFGRKEDDYYETRKTLLNEVYDAFFKNPLMAARKIEDYKEPEPTRGIFLEGYNMFGTVLKSIYEKLKESEIYKLTEKARNLRDIFLSFAEMKSAAFVPTIVLEVPEGAILIDDPNAKYVLPYNTKVEIYQVPEKEEKFYIQHRLVLDEIDEKLKKEMKKTISENMTPVTGQNVDYAALYHEKLLEYRRYYMDKAGEFGVSLKPEGAIAMAKETVDWTLGMGAPIENLALDSDHITDIYIDAENSPVYLEHNLYGICHTSYRYNRKLLEYAFLNATLGAKAGKKLDEKNPLIDVMLNRLRMRCHLQGPPATFGELQCALRIMKPTPFTYSQYLFYKSMSAFFAGYDDTMVSLGCSEGVMGVKGCGKTSLTAAKMTAIGTQKRILPIQDIEEIPVRAYRKYGFHIGAAKVAPEETEQKALSLVDMTSALLRMGEAAVIINELRSRTAIQGIINLLNTQPGVFCLYNFHGESLKDVQDRLELVFGIPSASMFATDRYTFMHKFRFGRKERMFRIIRNTYETDPPERKFVETFTFKRGKTIEDSMLICNFVENPEANKWTIEDLDMGKIQKELKLKFVPPALKRRSDDTGVTPEQYILESFFKGRMYSKIYKDSMKLNNPSFMEMGFVLKCSTLLRRILKEKEKVAGEVDYSEAQKTFDDGYQKLLDEQLKIGKDEKVEEKKTEEK